MFLLQVIIIAALLQISTNLNPREAWVDYSHCRGCKLFVESFEKGLKATSKSSFGGGDSLWEQKNLGPYANSEVRLVEIQESACAEVRDDVEKTYCEYFGESYEDDIEEWWYKKQEKFPDIYKYLCAQKLKLCHCKPGYKEDGRSCVDVDECSLPYKNNCNEHQYCFNTEGSYTCHDCNEACKTCHTSGPDGCIKCSEGYKLKNNTCANEKKILQNDLIFVAVFWIVFMGVYFFKKNYALIFGIVGVAFSICVSYPNYIFEFLTLIRDEVID